MLAQGIEQGGARIERQPVLAAVDVERERGGIARGSRWRLARLGGFGAERRYVNDNLADYLVPVNADVDQMEIILVPEEDAFVNPAGVKGLGELANVGTAAAISSAVYHATGKRVRQLPIRIEHLL